MQKANSENWLYEEKKKKIIDAKHSAYTNSEISLQHRKLGFGIKYKNLNE